MKRPVLGWALAAMLVLGLAGCGDDGDTGPAGPSGPPGPEGPPGQGVTPTGSPTGQLNGSVSSVTIDGGTVTVRFTLKDGEGQSVAGAEEKNFEFQLAKLVPATTARPAYWQSYINRSSQGASAKVFVGGAERGKPTAVADSAGEYEYTFCTPLAAVASFQYYGSGTEPAGSCSSSVVSNSGEIGSAAWDAVKATLDLSFDPAATTRLAIAGRDGAIVNLVADFVPSSLPTLLTATAHQIVTEESCGACHAESSADRGKLLFGTKGSGHLGRRYEIGVCSACHNAASFNPDTSTDTEWESLDLRDLLHKLHASDDVHYPQNSPFGGVYGIGASFTEKPGVFNCRTCHDNQNPKITQPADRAEADKLAWRQNISQQACNSCHTVDFSSHYGNQPDNVQCAVCHGIDRSLPVNLAHATPYVTPNNPELAAGAKTVDYEIDSLTVDATTRQPTVKFRVLVDGTPLDLKSLPTSEIAIGGLNFRLAWSAPLVKPADGSGPAIAQPLDWNNLGTTAGRTYWNNTVTTGTGAYDQPLSVNLSTSGLIASLTGPDADGYFTTVPGINPANPLAFPNVDLTLAAVALESYLSVNGLNISGDAAMKGIDGQSTLRRAIVDIDGCNTCHERIGFHSNSGRMNSPEYCAVCHNPEISSSNLFAGTAQYASMTEPRYFSQKSNNFKDMIHAIHAAQFRRTQNAADPFNFIRANPNQASGGSGPMVFEDVGYPAQISDCAACHLPGTYSVPANDRYSWSVIDAGPALVAPADAASFDPALTVRQGPSAAACGSCHNGPAAQAHYASNTASAIGAEGCDVCHGPGKTYEAHK